MMRPPADGLLAATVSAASEDGVRVAPAISVPVVLRKSRLCIGSLAFDLRMNDRRNRHYKWHRQNRFLAMAGRIEGLLVVNCCRCRPRPRQGALGNRRDNGKAPVHS